MSVPGIDTLLLEKQFESVIPVYKELAKVLAEDLESLFKKTNIKYYEFGKPRIKEFDSFLEKIIRKGYKNPFKENEDFCGFRIVHFYLSEFEAIKILLHKNFKISPHSETIVENEENYFGYRSEHFIAEIKKDWLSHPKYSGFKGVKFEIQVRTLNMHSWSEASHSMFYKYENWVPKNLKRKLFVASALLEQVDVIFDELNVEIDKLSKIEEELTIYSLTRYLKNKFPKRSTNYVKIEGLFQEMTEAKVTIKDINTGFSKLEVNLGEIEFDLARHWPAVSGAARAILDITCDRFFENKQSQRNARWYKGVLMWRQKLNFGLGNMDGLQVEQ